METQSDVEHLSLLRIFWLVMAGLHALGGCIPIIHLVIGIALAKGNVFPPDGRGEAPPEALGWFFIILAVLVMTLIWTMAVLQFLTAQRLAQRRGLLFVQVLSVITCLSMPFGTLLGAFTLIVLQRPSVKASFQRNDPHLS